MRTFHWMLCWTSLALAFGATSKAETPLLGTAYVDFASAGMNQVNLAMPESPSSKVSFAKDTWTFQTYGSGRFVDNEGEMYGTHFGVGYYFDDDLSINLEGIGGVADVRDDAGSLFEMDLLIRWHFAKGESWSTFVDGGSGLIQTSISIPETGTHSNFITQIGFGARLIWTRKPGSSAVSDTSTCRMPITMAKTKIPSGTGRWRTSD